MKAYRKKPGATINARRYDLGEDLAGVSVTPGYTPVTGDMVAHNPKDPADQWLISKEFFEDNYELVSSGGCD